MPNYIVELESVTKILVAVEAIDEKTASKLALDKNTTLPYSVYQNGDFSLNDISEVTNDEYEEFVAENV